MPSQRCSPLSRGERGSSLAHSHAACAFVLTVCAWRHPTAPAFACCRIISDGAELSLRQHALTHVAEHFCYKFATRQMLDPPATALGQPLRALHTSLLATLFRLLAADDGQANAELLGAEAREAVRCAACSASQPELILQASMDALERALCPGQPCASAALSDASSADEQRLCGAGVAAVELGFEAIDLALGR